MKELTLFDRQNEIVSKIHHEGDMVSLTDLWKEADSIREKAPNFWINQDTTQQLIETVANMLNATQNCIIKSKRGKGGGTYAHKQIALAYAKYLDPKLHVLVNEVFFQRIEEEKNPDLIVDRAIATYKRRGYDEKWINGRLKGKATRNEFTACLAAHGVVREGFRNCTNAIYGNLYGGTTDVIRAKKHLPEKANIRDNMSLEELVTIDFAEMLAQNSIKANNLKGNGQCEIASSNASRIAANAVIQSRKSLIIN